MLADTKIPAESKPDFPIDDENTDVSLSGYDKGQIAITHFSLPSELYKYGCKELTIMHHIFWRIYSYESMPDDCNLSISAQSIKSRRIWIL